MSDQQKLITGLHSLLANSHVLYLQTQSGHWNITGMQFYALHKLFEEQYSALAQAIDVIAEQIRTLGVKVSANMAQFSKDNQLTEGAPDLSPQAIVSGLLKSHQQLQTLIEPLLTLCEQLNDKAIEDLLIQRMIFHKTASWMLQASLD
jgi:starvation-inducible DNA-binding protein